MQSLNDPDNHDGVVTYLEPDILECEVKWVLGSIITNKASGGDGIPAELFKILQGDAVKVLHSICQQIWKVQQWPQDWKRSVFIPIPKKGNAKNCSNYYTVQFSLVAYLSPTLVTPCQALARLLYTWDSPSKNTGGGCYLLLQGIFPTQVSCIAGGFFTDWATREALM